MYLTKVGRVAVDISTSAQHVASQAGRQVRQASFNLAKAQAYLSPASYLRPTLSPGLMTPGEAEEEGYDDEYQLEDLEVTPADYIRPVVVTNFRKGWEELDASSERADDYGLGQREGLQVRHSAGGAGLQWVGSRTLCCSIVAKDQGSASVP